MGQNEGKYQDCSGVQRHNCSSDFERKLHVVEYYKGTSHYHEPFLSEINNIR